MEQLIRSLTVLIAAAIAGPSLANNERCVDLLYHPDAPITADSHHSLMYRSMREELKMDVNSIGHQPDPTAPRSAVTHNQWLRDLAPAWGWRTIETAEGPREMPVLLTYTNLTNSTLPANMTRDSSMTQSPAGKPPGAFVHRIADQQVWIVEREFFGLMEGGNLQWTKDRDNPLVISSEKIVRDNRFISEETFMKFVEQIKPLGFEYPQGVASQLFKRFRDAGQLAQKEQTKEDMINRLADATGVPRDRVVIMPWTPGEKTGHVDTYVGLLKGNKIAIPEIPREFIERMNAPHEQAFTERINIFLGERVEQLKGYGAEIVRVPMLAPTNFTRSEISPLGWDANFPWTTNWAHHGGKLMIPHYPKLMESMPQAQRDAFYENIRKAVGPEYKVEFVDFDAMLTKNGGMHCATVDFPPLPFFRIR